MPFPLLGALSAVATVGGLMQGRKAAKQQAYAAQLQAEAQKKAAESSARQLEAQAEADEYNAQVMENNLDLARWKITDALYRGRKSADHIRRGAKRAIGSEIARQASSGVMVGSGTYGNIIDDTTRLAKEDVSTALQNAEREAYGHRMDRYNLQEQIKLTRMGAASHRRAAARTRETGVAAIQTGAVQAGQIRSAGNAQLLGGLAQLGGNLYDRYGSDTPMFGSGGFLGGLFGSKSPTVPMKRPGWGG